MLADKEDERAWALPTVHVSKGKSPNEEGCASVPDACSPTDTPPSTDPI